MALNINQKDMYENESNINIAHLLKIIHVKSQRATEKIVRSNKQVNSYQHGCRDTETEYI